jgi:hypothetical protein
LILEEKWLLVKVLKAIFFVLVKKTYYSKSRKISKSFLDEIPSFPKIVERCRFTVS